MTDIYQQIWTADQSHNGLQPEFKSEEISVTTGHIILNKALGTNPSADLRVIEEVMIPEQKSETYDLCRKLFNNYALPERDLEVDTPEERTERHEFIQAISNTPPMQIAREYISHQSGITITDERWHTTLVDHWFRRFEMGGDPHLSGFEHVVVGEQQGAKVQGYHFWYKYFLDDGFADQVDGNRERFPGLSDDRINYTRSKAKDGQDSFPESVTIEFGWSAPDYDRMEIRPLYKPTGGFFVGCSVEGLMALGTVRAHLGANAPKTAIIEGAKYKMVLYRSDNGRHIRTFYPVFIGSADPVIATDNPSVRPQPRPESGSQGDIRILLALVNPVGHDPGSETITLINVGPSSVDIVGWKLMDRNLSSHVFKDIQLLPGIPHITTLDGTSVQLSNKGGTISLMNSNNQVIHEVSYTKNQANSENRTILFT